MKAHINPIGTDRRTICGRSDARYVMSLARYRSDYLKLSAGRYRSVVCQVCERGALKLLRLPHPQSLRCYYCPHPLPAHRSVPDGRLTLVGCLNCPRTQVMQPDGTMRHVGVACVILNPDGVELNETVVAGTVVRLHGVEIAPVASLGARERAFSAH